MSLTEKQRIYQKEYYQRNKAKKLEYLHSWRAANKTLYQEINRQWRIRNPERAKQLKRETYWANPAWYRLKAKQYSSERRARLTGAGGTCSPRQWQGRCEMYLWRCAYCAGVLTPLTVTMDHVIAISKGGSHFPANIVPACEQCNKSKHNQLWIPKAAYFKIERNI